MPSSKPQKGINYLETVFPAIAKEADGWDPASVTFASGAVKAWKCEEHGHSWEVSISQRTGHGGRGCPHCAGQKVWVGFNDLKSQFPSVAAEANGTENIFISVFFAFFFSQILPSLLIPLFF